MTVAPTIILMIVVAGGLSVAGCVPPTPRAGPPMVPQVIKTEPLMLVPGQDWSSEHRGLSGMAAILCWHG